MQLDNWMYAADLGGEKRSSCRAFLCREVGSDPRAFSNWVTLQEEGLYSSKKLAHEAGRSLLYGSQADLCVMNILR